ncbi:hypothetical protein SAMN05444695_108143 [Rhodococcus triatomae]|uniref:Uncharacterized protein n=1 Tax=Rhodococcus triatomae TaxID=300028 RepID=A0A1G8LEI5_9NOCA|nr:hypothetical protein [Rhodococcus triatomae]SDI54128.1 hypothetical protein SAMN05444695_108143 [Rhodococcus triatomae]
MTNPDVTDARVPIPRAVSVAVERFLSAHGGSAEVVVEPVGVSGVRLALVGTDGVLGDVIVADTTVAQAVIEAFPDLGSASWDRALTSVVSPTPGHDRAMAGWLSRCTRGRHHAWGCRVAHRIRVAATDAWWWRGNSKDVATTDR